VNPTHKKNFSHRRLVKYGTTHEWPALRAVPTLTKIDMRTGLWKTLDFYRNSAMLSACGRKAAFCGLMLMTTKITIANQTHGMYAAQTEIGGLTIEQARRQCFLA